MGGDIALLCTLHPASRAKQDRCLSLLRRSAREYYRRPSGHCTAWSYCTPLPPKAAEAEQIVLGFELYTSKDALQAQVDDKEFFQAYHETVKKEGLYAKPEDLVAWYPAGGFVGRRSRVEEGGGKVVVSVSTLVCRDAGAVLGALREFSNWVHSSEPEVLTYTIFTRPKAKDKVLVLVRYANGAAMRGHDEAPEHQNIGKLMAPYLDLKKTSTTVWKEVQDSFVSSSSSFGSSKLDISKL